MAPVVAILGYSGTVGNAVFPELVKSNKAGDIKLIAFYRQGSDTSAIPSEVEKREVQLDESGLEKTKKAVEGVEVVISTVGAPGLKSQIYLIDALAGSPTLKTFVHSDFGCNWTREEIKAPGLSVIGVKEEVVKRAEEKKVPLTHFRVGLFDLYFFVYKALGVDVKANQLRVFRNSLNNPVRITTLAYLGNAVAQLVATPDKLVNKTVQLYDYSPTGQEFVDVLTKLHGKPTQTSEYAEEQYKEDLKGQFAIGAAITAKWGDDGWGASDRPDIKGWKSQSFEELVKAYL